MLNSLYLLLTKNTNLFKNKTSSNAKNNFFSVVFMCAFELLIVVQIQTTEKCFRFIISLFRETEVFVQVTGLDKFRVAPEKFKNLKTEQTFANLIF